METITQITVQSHTDGRRTYQVSVADGHRSVACTCQAFYYRGQKPGFACSHMKDIDDLLVVLENAQASLPLPTPLGPRMYR